MENFEFIESGIIFGLQDRVAFRKFRYSSKDFAKHGDAFKFVADHFDNYGETPSPESLCENFPTLNSAAQTLNFDYVLTTFQNQVLFRHIVSTFQENKELLSDNPKQALSQISHGLNDISAVYDEDVLFYNHKAEDRFTDWQHRIQKRTLGDGIMGIPTPFTTLNRAGVGWLPGELIALYARPSVGKSWMCVAAAVTAVMKGFKTLLITSEMPTAQMNLRTDVVLGHSMGYNFSHTALRNGNPINEDSYKEFLSGLENVPMLICDHIEGEDSISLESIHSLIRKYVPDFVVIDGIYLITNAGKGNRAMWEQTHMLFYGLKNMCLSTNTPIFISTQATKDAADVYIPPKADQVAYGDAMLRAADVVMSMCMVENEDNRRYLYYQKYRDGLLPLGRSLMEWEVDRGQIGEINEDF
jgi:replicative DNA helicase